MSEKPIDFENYKKEKFKSIVTAIEAKVASFLELNAIPNASIVWDADSDIFQLEFTLVDNDMNASLLVWQDLHASLINSFVSESIPGLEGYVVNPYAKQGFISFIKNPE